MRRPTALLLAWAAFGLVVVIVVYIVMVELRHGQRVDFSAFEGRKWMSLFIRRRAAIIVGVATPLVAGVVVLASMVVALVRRGPWAAVAVGASGPVALLLSRLLRSALERQELLPGSWIASWNTYPSGHLTALAAVLLVAIGASPPAWRSAVSAFAAVALTCQILGIAGSGWHRPSDLVGALGLAVAVGSATSALVVGQWRGAPESRTGKCRPSAAGVLLGAAAVVGATSIWFGVMRLLGGRNYGSFGLHVAVVQGVIIAGYSMIVLHAVLVTNADGGIEGLA